MASYNGAHGIEARIPSKYLLTHLAVTVSWTLGSYSSCLPQPQVVVSCFCSFSSCNNLPFVHLYTYVGQQMNQLINQPINQPASVEPCPVPRAPPKLPSASPPPVPTCTVTEHTTPTQLKQASLHQGLKVKGFKEAVQYSTYIVVMYCTLYLCRYVCRLVEQRCSVAKGFAARLGQKGVLFVPSLLHPLSLLFTVSFEFIHRGFLLH